MWAAGGEGEQRSFTTANGPAQHHAGTMMKAAVREAVDLGIPVEAIAELDRND